MPDLNAGIESKEKPTAMISFSYDNTLEEIDGAMKTFQQRFGKKRSLLISVAYGLFSVAAVFAIISKPSGVVAYLVLLLCLFGLYYTLTDKKRTRKKTIEALKDMDPEEYRAAIFNDKVEVETIIKPKQNQVDLTIDEDADKEIISPLKSTFIFGDDLLNFSENDESLLLIFNRRQIYCFPKRCLTKDQEEQIRDFLTEKLETSDIQE